MIITANAAKVLLLLIASFIAATGAMAQRQPNLRLAHYWGRSEGTLTFIKDNDAIVIDGNGHLGNYFLQWRVVNSGATAIDTIAVSDTVKIKTVWNTYKVQWGQGQFPNGMKQQDTVFITPASNPVSLPLPAELTSSQDSVVSLWCDSVYFVSDDATNPAIEADPSDNVVCDTVFVTYWRTGVEEIIGGSGIMLYPNPAISTMNIRYDFRNADVFVQIVDVAGKLVYSQHLGNNLSGIQEFSLDIAHLQPGMYFLKLNAGDKTVTDKFIIH